MSQVRGVVSQELSYSHVLNISHVNVNCLTNKLNYLFSFMSENKVDILGISETWLTNDINDSIVSIPNYNIVRSDNPNFVKKHGVAVYIKCSLKFQVINISLNVIILFLVSHNIFIILIYRPPSYTELENQSLLNCLIDFCSNKEVVLMGDFNLPSLCWHLDDISSHYISPVDRLFYECFVHLGLVQIVREGTHFPSGHILDLFFVTDSERIGSCVVLAPLPRCCHAPILCSYVFQNLSILNEYSSKRQTRLWTRGNYNAIRQVLLNTDWYFELNELPPDLQFDRLLSLLHPLINRYIPLKTTERLAKPPWNTNPPRSLKRERSNAWQRYKNLRFSFGRNHNDVLTAWQNYTLVNEQILNFAVQSQKDYELSISRQVNTQPKLFHSYIKHRKVCRPSIGPIKLPNGQITDDPVVMANNFVLSFARVFNSEILSQPKPHQTCNNHADQIIVTPAVVESIICSINLNSSMGEDGIHPRFLYSLRDILSIPLSIICKSSLQTGILPAQWLISIVVPIFKKSHRYDPLNYRPISLTSIPCKILEKLIVCHLTEYFDSNNILIPQQYGFRTRYSTVDQLIRTYSDITSMIDQGKVVDLVFMDYTKAFDRVCHRTLLCKLRSIGIGGCLLGWLNAFLMKRTMKVRVGDCFSDPVYVTSGVPQGSVLGPLLFLIYINHVASDVLCYFKIFADDTKLYLGHSRFNFDDSLDEFQVSIDALVNTSLSWGLEMNTDKCVVMRLGCKSSSIPFSGMSPYHINGCPINFVYSHSDLGVTVDRNLKFHSHIIKRAAMANGITTNLLTCTLNRNSEFLMNIYLSHIRPLMEYGSALWNVGYLGDLRMMERVQRRWTREVEGFQNLSYRERLEKLDLFSFQGRLLRSDLIMVYKILHSLCAINANDIFILNDSVTTRGHPYKLFKPRSHSDCRKRFFSVRVVNAWNSLSHDTVTAASLNSFKARLKIDLGGELYESV